MEKWKEQIKGEDIVKKVTAKRFIDIFENAKAIKEFDMNLHFKLIEKITGLEEGRLIVR